MKHKTNHPEKHPDSSVRIGDIKTQPSPETLRQETEAADWLQARGSSLEMRSGFLPVSCRRLISRIEQKARRSLWERFWAVPRLRLAANAASFAVLLLVLVFFQSVLFSAARLALPGEVLYSVKLGIEQVQVGLSVSDGQSASLHVALARERSNELQALLIEGEYAYVEMTSLRMLEQVETAQLYLARAEDLSRARQLALVKELNQILSIQSLVLQALMDTTPAESQPFVRHVLLAVH